MIDQDADPADGENLAHDRFRELLQRVAGEVDVVEQRRGSLGTLDHRLGPENHARQSLDRPRAGVEKESALQVGAVIVGRRIRIVAGQRRQVSGAAGFDRVGADDAIAGGAPRSAIAA